MNYSSTFIAVAPDTKATAGTVPPARENKPSIAQLEYELISAHPYEHTQEEVQFLVHVTRLGLSPKELKTRRDKLWTEFFAKPCACFRTSPLPRTYGWGLHFDDQGRVALVALDCPEYQRFVKSKSLKQLPALRSKRA